MLTEPPRIIIVEDDRSLRESLIEYLTLVDYQVVGAGSGLEFYRLLDSGSFDIAVIDIGLPDQSGLVLAEYLRTNTAIGVIILTAKDSQEDQLIGYQAGADLYLTKPVNSGVLASAIARLVTRLRSQVVPAQPQELPRCWIVNQAAWMLLSPQNATVTLTAMELGFLKLLAQSPGKPVSRHIMIQQLYSNSMDDSSSRALDALVRRLRQKISSLPGCPTPVKSVYGVGFCFSEPFFVR